MNNLIDEPHMSELCGKMKRKVSVVATKKTTKQTFIYIFSLLLHKTHINTLHFAVTIYV